MINHFGDEDPIVLDGRIVNDQFYTIGLLWIQSMRNDGERWALNPEGHLLDLGWYPDSDPQGSYRLVVIRRDWNNILATIESADRREIRAAIEKCLHLITQGVDDRELSHLVRASR
ncbi:MAG TPA: hypothetical protein VEX60_02000 [Pyrinomonadaceae bacterium]|nr:hypothetical protein [Pyrinomonadaceae bacterium]